GAVHAVGRAHHLVVPPPFPVELLGPPRVAAVDLPVVRRRRSGHEELRGSQQLLHRLAGGPQRRPPLPLLRPLRRAAVLAGRPLLLRCRLAHALTSSVGSRRPAPGGPPGCGESGHGSNAVSWHDVRRLSVGRPRAPGRSTRPSAAPTRPTGKPPAA